MVHQGRKVDRAHGVATLAVALLLSALPLGVLAGDDAHERPLATSAPLEIPHATNLQLDEKARKRTRKPRNVENHDFLVLTPALRWGI